MEQAEAIAIARAFLYPKGLPHPVCDADQVALSPDGRCFFVRFPIIWWVNRNTLRKLARRHEPVPAAPSVRDPSHEAVIVENETGRAHVTPHP